MCNFDRIYQKIYHFMLKHIMGIFVSDIFFAA